MSSNWWDSLAAAVQSANRISEAAKDDQYEGREVKRSIVYAREDLALVVVHISSVNKQLSEIKVLLRLILAALSVIIVEHFF